MDSRRAAAAAWPTGRCVLDHAGNEVRRAAEEKAPAAAFVFKTIADPFAGRLSMFRVISGVLKGDTPIQNVNHGVAERLGTSTCCRASS